MKKDSCAGYNSVLSSTASVGENCYFEVCSVHSSAKIGNNVVLSCLKIGGRLCLFLSKPIWHLLFSISFTENVEIVASFNEV